MYLLEFSLSAFGQFVQIILWISLPFTIICMVIATILHYRRKKKESGFGFSLPPQEVSLEFSGDMVPAPMLKMNVMGNHEEKQYEQQLYKAREKYHLLEGAFRKLQEDYSNLMCKVNEDDSDTSKQQIMLLQSKVTSYENEIAQLQGVLKEVEGKKAADHSLEDLQDKFEKTVIELNNLQSAFQELSAEHDSLKTELAQKEHDIKNMSVKLEQAAKEPVSHSADVSALQDIVQEKKAQIDFLQHQLDQRIQAFHQSEHKLSETTHTINGLQEEANRLQSGMKELLQRCEGLEQINYSQNVTVGMLENRCAELQQENTTLFDTIADSSQHVNQLEEELARWQQRAKSFEEKWEQNSLLISRIYRELTLSVGNDGATGESGAIITIRENGQEEMAVA